MLIQRLNSLSVRFLMVNILVAIVPLVVFFTFTVPRTETSMADSLRDSLKTKAIIAAYGIDRFLEERVVEARVLSQADVLETNDVAAQIQYLTEVVDATPWIDDLDIVGIDGITICSSGDQNEKGLLASKVLPGIGPVIRAAADGQQGDVFVSASRWMSGETTVSAPYALPFVYLAGVIMGGASPALIKTIDWNLFEIVWHLGCSPDAESDLLMMSFPRLGDSN